MSAWRPSLFAIGIGNKQLPPLPPPPPKAWAAPLFRSSAHSQAHLPDSRRPTFSASAATSACVASARARRATASSSRICSAARASAASALRASTTAHTASGVRAPGSACVQAGVRGQVMAPLLSLVCFQPRRASARGVGRQGLRRGMPRPCIHIALP